LKVAQAGVDTWSPAWYVEEGSRGERAMRALASVPSKMGLRLVPESVAGHRLGWYPARGLVVAEGHPGGERLGSPDDLPAVLLGLEEAIGDYGVPLPTFQDRKRFSVEDGPNFSGEYVHRRGFAGIRRLDATADLRFESRSEGQAVLNGVAGIARLRQKAEIWYDRGDVQTVYFLGGKRKLGRWYDKGVESGSAPRGRLIRPEDQRRYVSGTRRDVEELTTAYVRQKFQQRFMPLWKASKGVVVAGTDGLTERVLDLLEADEISVRQAERMAGYLALRSHMLQRERRGLDEDGEPLPSLGHKRSTAYAREGELLEHGLVPADESGTEVTVDLHEVLEQVLESDAWERRG